MKNKKKRLSKTYSVRFQPDDIRILEYLAVCDKTKPTKIIRDLVETFVRSSIQKPKYHQEPAR